MDFSVLPDHVLLEIFRNLPLKDRGRAGRVNSQFRRISKMAISETTELEIGGGYRFTPVALNAVLNLCASNVEKVRFCIGDREDKKRLLETFSEFYCPNLTTIKCTFGEKELLNMILRNTPSLKDLSVGADRMRYPDIISEQLESLACWRCDDDSLRSLTGCVPHLKELSLQAGSFESAALDRFLATVPQLETLRFCTMHGSSTDSTDSFWRLECLKKLETSVPTRVGNDTLMKIAKSFPRLRTARLYRVSTISNDGLVALSSLTDLQELTFHCRLPIPTDLSTGIRALSKCSDLRELRFSGVGVLVSQSALAQLLHSCPQLNKVEFLDLVGVESEEQAAAWLLSLAGLGKRKIRIILQKGKFDIWMSKLVTNTLAKLKEEHGLLVVVGDVIDQ